jgi:hypothetical protein
MSWKEVLFSKEEILQVTSKTNTRNYPADPEKPLSTAYYQNR